MPDNVRPEPTRLYRWMVLVFVSLAMFGSYYAYDALSPLADVLKVQLGFSDENIGFLQAIYSFPEYFYGGHRRIPHRPPRPAKILNDFRHPVPRRSGNHRGVRIALGHVNGAAGIRHGR